MEWRSFLLFVKAGTASLFLVSWLCELVITKELRIMSVDGRDTMLSRLFLLLLNVAGKSASDIVG